MTKNILFNKQGLEWYHLAIIIAIAVLVFYIPFKEDLLKLEDFTWSFLDASGKEINPEGTTIRGGFGTTSDTKKLVIGYTVGTVLLAQPPYGIDSVHGSGTARDLLIRFPKSNIIVTHKSDCSGPTIDGVSITAGDISYNLLEDQKMYLTNQIIISPNKFPNCDWVWISGNRKETLWDFYAGQYFKKKEVLIPAQPFSVVGLGE